MIAHEIWPRPRGMRRPAHCKTQLRQHDAMVEQSHAKQSRSLATQKTVAQGTIATSRGTVAAPLPRRSTTAQNATGLRPKTRNFAIGALPQDAPDDSPPSPCRTTVGSPRALRHLSARRPALRHLSARLSRVAPPDKPSVATPRKSGLRTPVLPDRARMFHVKHSFAHSSPPKERRGSPRSRKGRFAG